MKMAILSINIFTILLASSAIFATLYLPDYSHDETQYEIAKNEFLYSDDLGKIRNLGIQSIEVLKSDEKLLSTLTKAYVYTIGIFIPLSVLNIIITIKNNKKPNHIIKSYEK